MDRIKYLTKLFKNILQNCLQYVFFVKKEENNKFLEREKKNQEIEKERIEKINVEIKEVVASAKNYNPIRDAKFNTSLLRFYVNKNIDRLLKEDINVFNLLNIVVKIGIETEFYSTEKISDIKSFYDKIMDFSNKNSIGILNIEKERGDNQFEIQFKPYLDLWKLIEDYNRIKNFLIGFKNISFKARPFYHDVGSALQINITLNKDGQNLFARVEENGKKGETELLKNCVAGLLKKNNTFLPLYINSKNCLERYDLEICKIFYKKGKIPGPAFNSWGINNRTCSIRIPVPKNFNNSAEYELEDKKNRRIEFRVPSSDSDVKLVLYGVLESLLFGIENDLQPPEPVFDNVFENAGDLEIIGVE